MVAYLRVSTFSLTILFSAMALAQSATTETLRYRGQYTFGHEVNIFCPAINSQCYWLSGGTSDAVRAGLEALTGDPAEYEPVCVVVEGRIDRESPRDGFAADYDGLFTAARLFGTCEATSIVTQGDLQHHRWVLESIDGDPLDGSLDGLPELDFGERMTVSGSSGCNRISGQAVLRERFFVVPAMVSTRRSCASPAGDELERIVLQTLGSESIVRIDDERALILESEQHRLRFRLDDWRE